MEFESKGILASRSVVSTLCLVELSQSVGSNVDEMKKRHWSRPLDAVLLLPSQLTALICSVFCDLGILLGKKNVLQQKEISENDSSIPIPSFYSYGGLFSHLTNRFEQLLCSRC